MTPEDRSEVGRKASAAVGEEAEGGIIMQKWEYHCEPFQSSNELVSLLNKLGDDGWELVTLLAQGTASHGQIVAKRQNDKAWSRPVGPSPA
jgi:hypothetical protein